MKWLTEFTNGVNSNVARSKVPMSDASTPVPTSWPRPALPSEYVPLAASRPSANSSCTVGARKERATLSDAEKFGVICWMTPTDAVTALWLRDWLWVWKTESVD